MTTLFPTSGWKSNKFWIGCSLLLSMVCLPVDGRAILGIDLGSLYMKVALVRSGSPLEIVTNLHSKRKTEQMILFDQGQRFYGADANALVQRKAQFTPCSMSQFLGRTNDHPNVQALLERHYPVTPAYNETRKGPTLKVPKAGDFTPEELVSMVLRHAVEISVAYAKEAGSDIAPPSDIVLTVPCFYTHLERKALLDAARLANLNVLTLIDETTAAALHYAHDKNFEEEQVFLFYNMGAASLQVSIVKFFQYEQKQGFGKPKPVPALQVLAKKWDATLGGLSWDHTLVEHLADQFNKLWRKASGDETKDVRKLERAMTKIRLAANKAKHVLSANMDYPIQLFGLHDDVSLDVLLTRDEFDAMTAPLLDRAIQPVLDALVQANMTTANLTGIELLGGGMRVPSIQTKLAEVLAPVEIGLHMNSDESMALGAAFAGANISTAFRVRPVGMTDLTPFAQQISLSNLQEKSAEEGTGGWFSKFRKTEEKKKEDTKEEEEEEWNKKATLFKASSKVGVKKTIAFTHDKDIHCALDYVESDLHAQSTNMKLERYEVSGVSEFAKELQEKKLEGKPKVSLQFELLPSGITSLVKAEASMEETYIGQEEIEVEDDEANNATDASGEETEVKDGNQTSNEANQTSNEANLTSNEANLTSNEANLTSNEANLTSNETEAKPKEKVKDKKKKKKMKKITVEKEKKRIHKRTLKVSTYYEGLIQPHWDELFEASKAKLEEMDARDNARIMLEEAKNRVESYMFTVKNKLSDLEEELSTVSTEEQREECRKLATDAEMWLEDESYDADLLTMEAKFIELSAPFEKILLRLKEKEERPVMIGKIEKILTQTEELLTKWETTMPQVTEEEREKVKERIALVRANITELEGLQAAKAPHEDPAYLSADLPPKLVGVESLMQRLSKKPKPKPPKKATNKTSSDPDSSNTTADESETNLDGDESNATSTDEPAPKGDEKNETKEQKQPSDKEKDETKEQTQPKDTNATDPANATDAGNDEL